MKDNNMFDSMHRRWFLRASAGTLGASALSAAGSDSVRAQATDAAGWTQFQQTDVNGDGQPEFSLDYDAPRTVEPDGLLGTVSVRARSVADGEELVRLDAGLGIDPSGRYFEFEGDDGDARLRGVVAVEPASAVEGGDPNATGNLLGIAFQGDDLVPGSRYTLDVNYGGEQVVETVDFVAGDDGRGTELFGPAEVTVDDAEEQFELQISGEGFTQNTTSPPGDELEPEAGVGEYQTVTNEQTGYTMEFLEPSIELLGADPDAGIIGDPEMEFVGGASYPFVVQVTDNSGNRLGSETVVVERQVTIEAPETEPTLVNDGWHAMLNEPGTGTYSLLWEAPRTAEPEGLLGAVGMRVRDGDGPDANTLVNFEAGFGLDPAGREFLFDSDGGGPGRIRGVVAVEPAAEVFGGDPNATGNLLGVAFQGANLQPGGEYTLTVTHDGQEVVGPDQTRFTADTDGRGATLLGPVPTDAPNDEANFRIEISGPGFTENTVSEPGEGGGPVEAEPRDLQASTVTDPETGYTLEVLDPAVEFLGTDREIELIAGDIYGYKVRITDANGNLVDGANVEWQMIVGDQVQQPFTGQLPVEERPGDWYTMPYWSGTGLNVLDWNAPATADPAGVHANLAFRVRDDATNEVRASAELSDVVVEPNGRDFEFTSPTDGRVRGFFVVEPTADGAELGVSARGDGVQNDTTYTLALSGGGQTETISLTSNNRGRISRTVGPIATDLPVEESEIVATLSGGEFGSGTGEAVPEEEPIPAFGPYLAASTDQFKFWVLSPPVDATAGAPEVELTGGQVVSFRTKVTDASVPDDASQLAIEQAAPVEGLTPEWSLLLDGEPQIPITETRHTAIISSRFAPDAANYEMTVTGNVRVLPNPRGDFADGAVARGTVTTWKDGYEFTGDIADLTFDSPVRLFVDGIEYDPETLQPVGPPDFSAYPNRVIVDSSKIPGDANYDFTVSGEVVALDNPRGDYARGNVARGLVKGWKDGYAFSGNIETFNADGTVQLFVNGVEYDPGTLAPLQTPDPSELPNRIVIDSSTIEGDANYELTVDGQVVRLENPRGDFARGNYASGLVKSWKDGYAFSGGITGFQADAEVRVFVNGQLVDQADLPPMQG